MSKVWFTSDHHFGHANINRFCNRPWENVKDAIDGMIYRHNEVVKNGDRVYVIGDFLAQG